MRVHIHVDSSIFFKIRGQVVIQGHYAAKQESLRKCEDKHDASGRHIGNGGVHVIDASGRFQAKLP